MIARKTANNNYLVFDKTIREYRFVDSEGTHLRWVDEDEGGYLCKVLEPEKYPNLVLDNPTPPSKKTVWYDVKPPEHIHLSNNGGSYAFLTKVEHLEGWGGGLDGFRLVTNHLYDSDYEDQGWNIEKYFNNEDEALEFIEKFQMELSDII